MKRYEADRLMPGVDIKVHTTATRCKGDYNYHRGILLSYAEKELFDITLERPDIDYISAAKYFSDDQSKNITLGILPLPLEKDEQDDMIIVCFGENIDITNRQISDYLKYARVEELEPTEDDMKIFEEFNNNMKSSVILADDTITVSMMN